MMKVNNLVIVHEDEVVGIITNRCRKDHKTLYKYRFIGKGKKIETAEDNILNAKILRNKLAWQAHNMLYNRIEKESHKVKADTIIIKPRDINGPVEVRENMK